jgi:hypothetical protein
MDDDHWYFSLFSGGWNLELVTIGKKFGFMTEDTGFAASRVGGPNMNCTTLLCQSVLCLQPMQNVRPMFEPKTNAQFHF